jgi:hypothetical protein
MQVENGWGEYKRLVLAQLESLTDEVRSLRDEVAKLRVDVGQLKVQAAGWGVVAGAGISLLLRFAFKI